MRFSRFPRHTVRENTPRRVAAAKRAVQTERDKFSLFPELCTHKNAEERLIAIEVNGAQWWQEFRDLRAKNWHSARANLRAIRPSLAEGIKRYWQTCRWPGDPTYLLGLIHDCTIKRKCPWRMLRLLRMFRCYGPRIATDEKVRAIVHSLRP